jgi:hypothetical protein
VLVARRIMVLKAIAAFVAVATAAIALDTPPQVLAGIALMSLIAVTLTSLLTQRDREKATLRLGALGLDFRNYSPRIEVRAQVSGEPTQVLESCRQAIQTLPNAQGFVERANPVELSARTRRTDTSWGEQVTVRIDSSTKGIVDLTLKSQPIFPFATDDSGISYQNIALILRYVHQNLGVRAVEPSDFVSLPQ